MNLSIRSSINENTVKKRKGYVSLSHSLKIAGGSVIATDSIPEP